MSLNILAVLALTLLVGMPIFAALALTTFSILSATSSVPLSVVAQRMFAGIDNFTLLSIPLFILAAELMRIGGLAERLVALAEALVGWFSGGLAFAAVLACVFFASISGSSPATLAAIGTILIPVMINAGYGKAFSVGLVTTAGSLGLVIPPSITLIIYGAVTGTSIGRLFAAGILPGLFLAGLLGIYCFVHAKRSGMTLSQRPSARAIARAFRGAAWGLFLPVILLGGIYSGVFTPTESAAVACVYGAFVGIVVYRQIGLREMRDILVNAGLISSTLLLITAGASALSWLLASNAIPRELAQTMLSASDQPVIIVLMLNLILLVAGCFLDGASAVIVLAPLLEPVARDVGIDPVHFGIITLINVEIGMLTPPVGLNLFVACHIAGMPLLAVARAVLPSLGVLLLGLIVITFVPWLSLALPNLLYP
ncbi:TRAP transporter large permease [Acuticoccus sp. M5D2P5]|uniref:TRAP transporter large permease n=1 Tax=Acuticoccus kalidii TaxID=2910977 RepID=UPI001F18C6D8|nr:TRAP transporter large permease [Acuticoccus kalidii]MCF3933160.1 TRAP transporter large permease [Acuticoccus kalidii]